MRNKYLAIPLLWTMACLVEPAEAQLFFATDTGRPYSAMEYVPGVPTTEHCDRQKLSIDERLDLFVRVASQECRTDGIAGRGAATFATGVFEFAGVG